MKRIDHFFTRIVEGILRYPKTVLLLATLLTVFAVYLTQKITVRTNLSDLLPDNHPAVLQARELDKVVGGSSFIVVAVETTNGEAAGHFLDDLHEKVSPIEGVCYIDDRPPTDFLKKEALLYLSLEDLDRLSLGIKRHLDQKKLKKLLIDLDQGAPDEMGEIEDLKKKYAALLETHPRYQNNNGTLFVSLIKPDWRASDSARTTLFVSELETIVRGLNSQKYDPSLKVHFTGPYIKQMTQKRILVKDAVVVSTVSFIGAILYLIFHFRRKRAVLLIGVPLTISTVWSLALAYLLFGSLNLFSSVACAVLLGLAADYGIHIYSEYRRHRTSGEGPEEAIRLSIGHLGRAFVAGSSTTAAAFFALTLSDFKALHEFGMIAGCGIILCLVAFLILFPPLTLLIEKWRPEEAPPPVHVRPRLEDSANFTAWIFSPKNLILTSLVLLLPFASVIGGRLRFDYDLNHILGRQETKALDQRIDEIFHNTVNPEVALAANLEEAGRVAQAIRKAKKKNKSSPGGTTIKEVLSLTDLVPPLQEEKKKKIFRIRSLFTPLVLKGMDDSDRKTYGALEGLLDPGKITLDAIPTSIKNKFRDRTGTLGRIIFIFPNFEINQGDRFLRFVEEVRDIRCPDCSAPFYASGEATVHYEIVKMLFREGRIIIGFTVVAVLTALLINFRSIRSALLVFSPLLIGMLATLGWLALTGTPFNIINLAAIPIILGTADDYGIHFYQRFIDQRSGSLLESWRCVFRPILGSALTTLIGFGSLGLADVGGVRSFGIVCVIGIALCAVTTLLWFPAVLSCLKARKTAVVLLRNSCT